MAIGLSEILGGGQLLAGLFGALGSRSAMRRAMLAREMALADIQRELDAEYSALRERNMRSLYAAAGQSADAIGALGRRLGSALAGAGVYNSSSVAGALANAQDSAGAQLASMAAENAYNERSLLGANRRYLAGLRHSTMSGDYENARSDYQSSLGGLASFLGQLAQYNLARRNVPNAREQGVAVSGMQNSVLPTPYIRLSRLFNRRPLFGSLQLNAPAAMSSFQLRYPRGY